MASVMTSVTLGGAAGGQAAKAELMPRIHSPRTSICMNFSRNGWMRETQVRRVNLRLNSTPAGPQSLSDAVSESIKHAQEACASDPESGECVAAWDEVEELSAAASHARQKQKEIDSDPLEVFCKDNPETDECRTYED